jgi:uncharacterized membrane protein
MTDIFGGWGELIAAFAVFFASHSLPSRPPLKRWLRDGLGAAYTSVYSAVSLAALAWLIVAAGRAPYVEIWPFAPWQLWVPNVAMPFVCLLIAFGAGARNPFSILPRGADGFDPREPGIAGITRHPLLWAITLWALAHLAPNGDLAHLILFGLFGAFGLIGMAAIDGRRRREWGRDVWARRAAGTSFLPFAAILSGRYRPALPRMNWPRLAAALLIYLSLFLSHAPVIGVSPMPVP